MADIREPRMGPWEWLMLLTLSILWGGSFFFTEVALVELATPVVVLFRVLGGALVLWAAALLKGFRPPRSLRLWGWFMVMGLLNNVVPFTLIVWGQTRIGGSLAAILNAATPLFSLFAVRYLAGGERIDRLKMGGLILGIMGVAVLLSARAGGGPGSWPDPWALGRLAVLAAAVSYALAGVYGRRFAETPPLITAAGQLSASSLIMLALTLLGRTPWPGAGLSYATWAAVLGSAALSTALAYVLYFRILKTSGPTNVLLVTLLMPVSTILLSSLVLNERILGHHLAGMALIGAALLAIDGRILKALRRKRFKTSMSERAARSRPDV